MYDCPNSVGLDKISITKTGDNHYRQLHVQCKFTFQYDFYTFNFQSGKILKSQYSNYVSITRWNTFPRDLSQIQQLTGEGGLQDSLSLPLVYVHSHICRRKDRKTTVGISLDCASQECFLQPHILSDQLHLRWFTVVVYILVEWAELIHRLLGWHDMTTEECPDILVFLPNSVRQERFQRFLQMFPNTVNTSVFSFMK